MQSTIVDFEARLVVKDDTKYGILSYDKDNAYPQKMKLAKEASGTTSDCVDTYAKFIRGNGFENTSFYSSQVNRKKQTWDKILKLVSKDSALYGGSFALHFNYNILGEISEINHIPFEDVRLCIPDDAGYISKVKIYPDWGRKQKKQIDEKKITTHDVFNPDKAVVLAQIAKAGGIEKYMGQVLYFNEQSENYPLSTLDPIFEDCETDAELKYYNNRNVTTGFLAQFIWIQKGKFADKKSEQAHADNLRKFQGTRQSSKILQVQIENDGEKPEILPIENNIDDELFAYTEKSVVSKIIRRFQIPTILLGIPTEGALGDKNDREGAKNTYSEITKDERTMMEAVFSLIFDYWHDQSQNPEKNFAIVPIQGVPKNTSPELYKDMTVNERRVHLLNLPETEEKSSATKLLAETIGVGGTDAMIKVITDPSMDEQQKKNTLILLFGLTEDQATKLVTKTVTETPAPAP